jgi:hypothetical protein
LSADVERRVVDAFRAARDRTVEHPDLFARVQRSIADAAERRRWRRRTARAVLAVVAAFAALGLSLSDIDNGRITMDWWVIELLTTLALVVIAVVLGPFIKRFGRSYAADVFRANPRTGKSYIVLTDVAYYLIFTAFILFTMTFEEFPDWKDSTGNQLKHEVARVGGILLMMGFLHAANVVALPMIGRLLTLNRRLDEGEAPVARRDGSGAVASAGAAGTAGGFGLDVGSVPLAPGTWIIRVEQAPADAREAGTAAT